MFVSFHTCDFILPSRFWQAFFAPKEHPKIARSFNYGSTPPKNKAPQGRQTKSLREILPPHRGLRIFIASNPQLKLRAILIRRPATAPQILKKTQPRIPPIHANCTSKNPRHSRQEIRILYSARTFSTRILDGSLTPSWSSAALV
jgi:hypothetical protein